ncbi:hypothetical protein HY643_00615, partial [Candidatus Woesearchaeota archaeon]|nr:hypothetical protein [Candidatus Woesearchaeota archaeon]
VFGTPEKIEPEKKLEVITSDEALRDKRIADLLAFGKTFYSNKRDSEGRGVGVADAFRRALDYAGKDGFVASMPELIAAKCFVGKDHEFWNNWHTTLSEEDIGIDKKGLFGRKGEPVLVVVHGGGILTPDRIEKAYAEGLVDGSAKYTKKEFDNLLEGRLPNGETIKIYILEDLKKGSSIVEHQFGVVITYEVAQATEPDWHKKKEFLSNPLVIARNGGLENLKKYFDKAKYLDGTVGNFHPFKGRNPNQAQGRLLFLDDSGLNLYGSDYLGSDGRSVGVSAGGT